MNKCLNCGKDLERVAGRRPKMFCDGACRVAYHRKEKGLEPKWVDRKKYEEALKRIAELESELSKKPQVYDLTKPTNVVKPPEAPKSNFTINTLSDYERKEAELRVKQLEAELRSPPKNTTIRLSTWKSIRETELANLKKQLQ